MCSKAHANNCLPCKLADLSSELQPLKNDHLSVLSDEQLKEMMCEWIQIYVELNQDYTVMQHLAIALYNLMKIEQMMLYGQQMTSVPFWTDKYFAFQCQNDFKYI
jgi:hypothetical protein